VLSSLFNATTERYCSAYPSAVDLDLTCVA
jgi:hypothetical protein